MKKILALGAGNKTNFSVMNGNVLFTSDIVENLADMENLKRFETETRKYLENDGLAPEYIVCDMHPDYRSSLLAEKIHKESSGSTLLKVQHHFAHIASCMLEHSLEEEVLGVSFDGTGYGPDGNSWGGEFLICTRKDFSRPYHLKYMKQPGGDIAAREGWRMAIAYLVDAFGPDIGATEFPLVGRIGRKKIDLVSQMIEKDVNCPLTSSMGRLFDAVASLAGICDVSGFEAEGAILLEKKVAKDVPGCYGYEIEGAEVVITKMIKGITGDVLAQVGADIISAKFHNTIGEIVFDIAGRVKKENGIDKVLISGGCFQNKYLVEYIEKRFSGSDLDLYKHKKYSPTDLGVSIGQVAVAASLLQL